MRDLLRIPIKPRPSKTLQDHSGVSPVAKKRKTVSYFTSKPVEAQEQGRLETLTLALKVENPVNYCAIWKITVSALQSIEIGVADIQKCTY